MIRIHPSCWLALATASLIVLLGSFAPFAGAHQSASAKAQNPRVPASLVVQRELGPPPRGVTDLKFRDIYKLPVGAKGLEPTDKLRSLDGKRVRIVGYMAQQETLPIDGFLLTPLPVLLGDEDESLADDLPASAILVELPVARGLRMPALPGLLQLSGTLRLGMHTDPASGRIAPARLVLDAAPARALSRLARDAARRSAAR